MSVNKLLGLLLGAVSCLAAEAKVIWREDFENKEKVAAEWKESKRLWRSKKIVPALGIIALDQSKKVDGKQCLRVSPDILRQNGPGDQRVLATAELPTNQGGVLTAWLYDYNESYAYCSGMEVLFGGPKGGALKVLSSGTRPYIYYVELGFKPKEADFTAMPKISRRMGWRKIQFVLGKEKTKGKVWIYIDGRFLAETKRSYQGFKSVSLGAASGLLRFYPLFFDAVSLDDDPNSIDQELYRGVDLTLSSDRVGNVFNTGDEVKFNLTVKNYAARNRKLRISAEISAENGDFLEKAPPTEFEVPANGTKDTNIKLPPLKRKGPLYAEFEVLEGDKQVGAGRIGFGIIDDPLPLKADGDSIVNAHLKKRHMRSFPKLGFAINRLMGLRWDPYSWPNIEPEKGKFNWVETDQEINNTLNNHGYAGVMYCLHSAPDWAADPKEREKHPPKTWKRYHTPPAKMSDWADYVAKMAARYKGKVKYWEIWNEVNTSHFGGSPEQYCQMLKTAYETIKKVDPEAKVVGVTCSGVPLPYYAKAFELGALNYLDVLGIHPYPHGRPEKRTMPKLRELRELMAKHGQVKPIWDTEFGFYTAGLDDKGAPKSSERIERDKALGQILYDKMSSDIDVANWTARLLALYMANGFEKVFYHGGAPMKHANGMAKYFVYSLAAAAQELEGAKFLRRVDMGEDHLRCYLFEKNGEYMAALWTVEGQENVALKLDKPEYQVVDLWGNVSKKKSSNQTAELLLTESPIYLKGISANLAPAMKNFTIEMPPLVSKPNFKLKIILHNPEKAPLKGKVTLKGPEGWVVTPEKLSVEVPQEAKKVKEFAITAPPSVCRGDWLFQAKFFSEAGTVEWSDNAKIATCVPISCPRWTKATGKAGADAETWEKAPSIDSEDQIVIGGQPTDHVILEQAQAAGQSFWDGPEDASAKFQAAWDDEFLHIFVKVTDDVVRNQHVRKPFFGDCVEIFVNSLTQGDKPGQLKSGRPFQFLFAPTMNGDHQANLWLVANGIVNMKNLTSEIRAKKVIPEEIMKVAYNSEILSDGYLLKMKIPFALLGCEKPKAGDIFGFDLGLDDQDQENKKRESQSFWMGDGDNHKSSSRYGRLILK